jgi:3'(2'), 5'-bisphosphate nucleotidase
MATLQLSQLHNQVVSIAKMAGDEIMRYYKDMQLWEERDNNFFSVKQDHTPVTLADQAADRLIVKELKALTPDIDVLSEEGGQKLSQYDLNWIVDPLDGTRQFVKRSGHFTVNIGLVRDGIPILGAVYEPAVDKMYSGYLGQAMPRPDHSIKDKLRICHGSFTQRIDLLEKLSRFCFYKGLDIQTALISSSYKYCLVADNTFDVAISIHKMSCWDIAAAHAVVTAAGGEIGIWDPESSCLKPIPYLDNLKTGNDIPPGVTALSARAIQTLGLVSKPLSMEF